MIDGLYALVNAPQVGIEKRPAQLEMRTQQNARTAGSMPTWKQAHVEKVSTGYIEQSLTNALVNPSQSPSSSALALKAPVEPTGISTETPFTFSDMIDMVNPLQHIPVVSHLYRHFTGDQIRPIGRMIGGGIYGGPLGVASALVNSVVEYETGNDMVGNAFGFMTGQKNPAPVANTPSQRLSQAVSGEFTNDMPGTLISFVDLQAQEMPITIQRITDDKPAAPKRAPYAHLNA